MILVPVVLQKWLLKIVAEAEAGLLYVIKFAMVVVEAHCIILH